MLCSPVSRFLVLTTELGPVSAPARAARVLPELSQGSAPSFLRSWRCCPGSTVTPDSIDDHLPDGFYDAGRDMPFMPLEEYECSIGLYAREVILLDRELDEELDAIASSAQLLLSSLKRPNYFETDEDTGQDLLRASVLALFVSDCFGGCDRSASLRRTRGAIVSLRKEQPFICTCAAGSICDSNEGSKQVTTPSGHFDFSGLCHKSIHIIKERRNSGIVPIGALQFGVCRHRAVLMKYLCGRADPPIPCELVRGHLDYTPHAWNVVHVRQGGDWLRIVKPGHRRGTGKGLDAECGGAGEVGGQQVTILQDSIIDEYMTACRFNRVDVSIYIYSFWVVLLMALAAPPFYLDFGYHNYFPTSGASTDFEPQWYTAQ